MLSYYHHVKLSIKTSLFSYKGEEIKKYKSRIHHFIVLNKIINLLYYAG